MECTLVALWLLGFLFLGCPRSRRPTRCSLPRRPPGSGFAVYVGTAMLTLAGFWLGHVWFGPGTAVAGLLVLGACSIVAGWTHAADYHSDAAYDRRTEHVRAIYEGDASERAEMLRLYDGTYVYLGPFERERYDVRLSAGPGLEPREFGDVTVSVGDRTALPAAG